MRSLALERQPIGTVTIDVCDRCQAIWFDTFESSQLSAAGTIELFRAIHSSAAQDREPLRPSLHCPRCREPLQLTHDLQRTTHFSYHRCPYGHGRFTAFFQFLREKNFVRPLDADELARLKQSVRTVRCAGCGAPIDLATATTCPYCSSPIAILDPDAVSKTLAELAAKPAPRPVDIDALAAQFALDQRADEARERGTRVLAFDLMGACVAAFLEHCSR